MGEKPTHATWLIDGGLLALGGKPLLVGEIMCLVDLIVDAGIEVPEGGALQIEVTAVGPKVFAPHDQDAAEYQT